MIARLIGHLNLYLNTDDVSNRFPFFLNQVTSIGEVIAWQIAQFGEGEFLPIARRAAQQAEAMPRVALEQLCIQHLPQLFKHRYFFEAGSRDDQIITKLSQMFKLQVE